MDDITLNELVVMVVEPSTTQRRIICNALHDNGVTTVLESASGEDTFERLTSEAPDLVISAMYLPDMTATDLVHRLRESSQHADTPFVLISSETRFQYLDPIRQAGVAGILPKPFTDQQLGTALVATLDMLSHTVSDHDLEEQALRVLVVDDSPMARKHISRVLNSLGIEHIDTAADGVEALERIAEHLYDFVVTDYNMPHMDGKELIDHIRHDSSQTSLPILMVTSEEDDNRLSAVQQSGVSAICDKPFEPAMIRHLVKRMVSA